MRAPPPFLPILLLLRSPAGGVDVWVPVSSSASPSAASVGPAAAAGVGAPTRLRRGPHSRAPRGVGTGRRRRLGPRPGEGGPAGSAARGGRRAPASTGRGGRAGSGARARRRRRLRAHHGHRRRPLAPCPPKPLLPGPRERPDVGVPTLHLEPPARRAGGPVVNGRRGLARGPVATQGRPRAPSARSCRQRCAHTRAHDLSHPGRPSPDGRGLAASTGLADGVGTAQRELRGVVVCSSTFSLRNVILIFPAGFFFQLYPSGDV